MQWKAYTNFSTVNFSLACDLFATVSFCIAFIFYFKLTDKLTVTTFCQIYWWYTWPKPWSDMLNLVETGLKVV